MNDNPASPSGAPTVPDPLLRIGEIAAFFGVSVKAIRHYEKKGLLPPAYVDPESGYRYYAPDQVQRLNSVLELKSLGFSLDEIRDLLSGGVGYDDLLAALARKSAAWQDARAVAQAKIESLQSIEERLARSPGAHRLQRMTDDERALLLVRMVCVEDLRVASALSEALWL